MCLTLWILDQVQNDGPGHFLSGLRTRSAMTVWRYVHHAGFKEESKVDARAGIIPDFI